MKKKNTIEGIVPKKSLDLIKRYYPQYLAQELTKVQPIDPTTPEKELKAEGYKPFCSWTKRLWWKK